MAAGRPSAADTPERVQMKLDRLERAAIAERTAGPAAAAVDGIRSPLAVGVPASIGFERVIDKGDFLNISFMELGFAVSRFVGRIRIRSAPNRIDGYGTGFMVSPRLLLTNNHVLSSREIAVHSEVEFDYQQDRFGRVMPVHVFRLDPQRFFLTSQELDYTLVAVQERSLEQVGLDRFGWNPLIAEQGKAILGDSLNIIQHPNGEMKQLVLRSNRLVDLFDHFAHYETDTEPGSSGSPVYNDLWEVVALHHSGVPKTENGRYIAKDGSTWTPGMDPDLLAWVANEGIRVSSLVADIKGRPLGQEAARLRDEMFALAPPNPIEVATRAIERPSSDIVRVPMSSGTGTLAAPGAGTASWTIPLEIRVTIGQPLVGGLTPITPVSTSQVDGQVSSPSLPASSVTAPPSDAMADALTELEDAQTRAYLDEDQDAGDRASYYRDVPDDLPPAELFDQLSELLTQTHRRKLSYQPSKHVYPWVDLHEGEPRRNLKSIYSGKELDPRELIEEDFRIEQERSRLLEILMRESVVPLAKEAQLSLLEASLPFNCEHVVPQSWFNKREPMRGDLHHLFACEPGCNSFRGNTPYFDFPDFEEVVREACGKRDGNRFEPSFGKGPVARATLYFLLRYPGEINATAKEYTEDRVLILLDWHRSDPPGRYERHRNAAIFEKQGNRNPLIDFPDWADRIDFTRGLG